MVDLGLPISYKLYNFPLIYLTKETKKEKETLGRAYQDFGMGCISILFLSLGVQHLHKLVSKHLSPIKPK